MIRRRRISVRDATFALIGCIVLVTGVIVYATRTSAGQHGDASAEASRRIRRAELYEDALGSAYNEWVTVIGYFVKRDPLYLERFDEARANVERSLALLHDDALARGDAAEVAELDALIETHLHFAANDEEIITRIGKGDLAGAIAITTDTGLLVQSDEFLGNMRGKIVDQRTELRAAQVDQQQAEATTLRWTLAIGAVTALFLFAVGFASFHWIGHPLRRASKATNAIADGDLTARVPETGPAELAQLGTDVNRMAEALIRRSNELNGYLSKDLEARTAELETRTGELEVEVQERRRTEEALERTLEAERELEKQLRHQAFHDPLTNLANRARFMDRLEHGLARATRGGETMAIVFMDLDDFKSVNDSLGHPAGDHLLVEVAARLAVCLRAGDTAARFGGDEFAVLVEETPGTHSAQMVAERIIEQLRAPFALGDTEVFVRASIGIAASESGGDRGDELVRRADVAMYAAKAQGKGRLAIYDHGMETSILERLELSGELQHALERNEFVIHYQPSIVLRSGRIAGVEALIRWRHPRRGLVQPAEFIALAEETGLILPIGAWVLRTACLQARVWQLAYPSEPPLAISVNVSARQVHQPGLSAVVADVLRETGLPPHSLVLEITESVMLQDADAAIARLQELKELGVRLAIDDFGTGYSSLSYLRRFPIDILKIDKSFVDGVNHQGKEQELARSIIELGQTLRLEIVAEGVERQEQLGWLQSLRCDLGQGFYFSEPLIGEDIGALLRAAAAARSGEQAA